MRLPGKIQDLAFLRYPGYMTLLFVNTNIESRTTKNAKMISHNILSIPLIIKTQKYYASHSEKKSYLTLTIERGNNTFHTPSRFFSLSPLCKMFMNTHDPTMNFHISYEQALSNASTRMAMLAEFEPARNPSVREE